MVVHKGACGVTGCTIRAALDAAHRAGRDWRQRHNSGDDGLLLRKDIHALYDAELVTSTKVARSSLTRRFLSTTVSTLA